MHNICYYVHENQKPKITFLKIPVQTRKHNQFEKKQMERVVGMSEHEKNRKKFWFGKIILFSSNV